MSHRPAILSAKFDRLAAAIEDGNDLKEKPKDKRPNQAELDTVRAAQKEAVSEISAAGGSVAAVEQVALPSERL